MRIFILLFMVMFVFQLQAQKAVLLKKANGQQQAFYGNQPVIDAYAASSHEDTIYVPGGSFVFPAVIDKRLAIYGAGHYPDSTAATEKTVIANAFSIDSNADSLHLEGMEFTDNINIGSNVNYLTFKRNNFQNITFGTLPVSSNSRFEGNVIRGTFNILYAANTMLVNNILVGQLIYAKNGDVVRNNILMPVSYPINQCSYALFENNIFVTPNPSFIPSQLNEYNTFSNNVFTMSPAWSLNPNYNNYINADAALLFTNQTGYSFSYTHNYHLQNPGTYVGADATQCGIYGGLFGYKEGGVPVNPHIRQKTIAGTTDVDGKLNVQITVAAQNN